MGLVVFKGAVITVFDPRLLCKLEFSSSTSRVSKSFYAIGCGVRYPIYRVLDIKEPFQLF